ncbi:MAG: glucose-6-phosphate isomerase [Actinobacteria bacterium]|nr:MAG: glucose-6-phosphate isomerase [Actinomycetota bacterium]
MSDPALAVEVRAPSALGLGIAEALQRAARARVAERLRGGDATLWGPPGAPEIADRLGWLSVAERMLERVDELSEFADEVTDAGFTDAVVLGMGGSSLAPEVLRRCFRAQSRRPRLHVLDSTDAAAIRQLQESVELQRTLFVLSSKSGSTIEPTSLFAHFFSLIGEGQSFIAITDPGTALEGLARERGFRRTFAGEPAIGGRYSALSNFGLVPAALMGLDLRALLNGAAAAWQTEIGALWSSSSGGGAQAPEQFRSELPACVQLGAAIGAMARAGRDKLTFVISSSLPGLGLWLEQLVAESTGKRGTGILPVAEEPLVDPEAYGEDRVFVHIRDRERPEPALDQTLEGLVRSGHPLITVPTGGPLDLGRLFMLWELTVAVAGWALSINPFDQPNVQQAKDATKAVLSGYAGSHELEEPAEASEAQLQALLAGGSPPQYVAIMGFVAPSLQFDRAAAELRTAIRRACRAAARGAPATTFGYGPRFLHSTGQFHKGGPRTGRFLQLLHDGSDEIEIPGAGYTFTTLKNAQAIGDLSTLRELGLPAERVRLHGDDPAAALRALTAALGPAVVSTAAREGGIR